MRGKIDPHFPFIQVDRDVTGSAARLAQVIDVPHQYAMGGLVFFWEGLADRRLLTGKVELVLPAAEIEDRILLAFGRPVKPSILVALGFLEAREGHGYRVRGMSRYISAEASRIKRTGPRPNANPTPTGVRPGSDRGQSGKSTVRPGSDRGPAPQSVEVRVERIEDRDQTSTSICGGLAQLDLHQAIATPPEPPALGTLDSRSSKADAPRQPELALVEEDFEAVPRAKDPRLKELQKALEATFEEATGARYKFAGAKDTQALKRILAHEPSVEAIARRFAAALANKGWPTVKTFAQLDQCWNDISFSPSPSPPKISDRRTCAGCGERPAPFEVWGHRACAVCHEEVSALLTGDNPSEKLATIALDWFNNRKRASSA